MPKKKKAKDRYRYVKMGDCEVDCYTGRVRYIDRDEEAIADVLIPLKCTNLDSNIGKIKEERKTIKVKFPFEEEEVKNALKDSLTNTYALLHGFDAIDVEDEEAAAIIRGKAKGVTGEDANIYLFKEDYSGPVNSSVVICYGDLKGTVNADNVVLFGGDITGDVTAENVVKGIVPEPPIPIKRRTKEEIYNQYRDDKIREMNLPENKRCKNCVFYKWTNDYEIHDYECKLKHIPVPIFKNIAKGCKYYEFNTDKL